MRDAPAIVDIGAVSKSFQAGASEVHALSDASLTIGKGEFICLIGASGCGKSSCCGWSAASRLRLQAA